MLIQAQKACFHLQKNSVARLLQRFPLKKVSETMTICRHSNRLFSSAMGLKTMDAKEILEKRKALLRRMWRCGEERMRINAEIKQIREELDSLDRMIVYEGDG